MKKGKEKEGISLIVLVITIIVIIILAAAVILTLNKNNPIEEANQARYESDVANMQAVFTNTVAKVMAKNQSTIEINPGSLNTVKTVIDGKTSVEGNVSYKLNNPQKESNKNGTIEFDKGNNTETVYYTGRRLPVYSSGETIWYVDSEGIITVEINGKKYGSGTKTEGNAREPVYEEVAVGEKVTGSVKQYTDANGKKAIIPIDFAIVPEKNEIDSGLVISDVANDTEDIGNQFVWVPVENMETFEREQGYHNGSLQTNRLFADFSEPLNYSGTTASESEVQEYNKMKASVREYHGFYIGRYEISNDGSNKAQSKKNKNPWIDIKWGNSMNDLSGGIVEKARGMYPEAVALKGGAVSTLVYGVCFDETVRFIKKSYPGIEKDSRGHGNHDGTNGNVVIPTGSKDEYALNNIYDIAGNAWEWTMESYTANFRDYRGGSCRYSGQVVPISYRSYSNSGHEIDVGGRVQLYIK